MSQELSDIHQQGTGQRSAVPESLRNLAPEHLPNRRAARYQGDSLCVPLARLAPRDQTLLRDLYDVLNELLYAIADTATDDAGKWRDVARWSERHPVERVITEVRELGRASHEQMPGEELSKAVHDVRGGALTSLLGRLQLLDRRPQDERELQTIFVLARDHLKIMRNAITGLDEPRRDADRKPKTHDMRLMLEKWHDSVVGPKWDEQPVRFVMNCRHEGPLTECCLESAALDRIFYNLANNAARHCAGDRVEMDIFPVPPPPAAGEALRFVLSNEVGERDVAYLGTLIRDGGADGRDKDGHASILALFDAEVSSTGSGFGLTVVAEFVAEAFGLRDSQTALRERYVGALLDGRTFRVWFHWPVTRGGHPAKLDDYHHPEQSLSEA